MKTYICVPPWCWWPVIFSSFSKHLTLLNSVTLHHIPSSSWSFMSHDPLISVLSMVTFISPLFCVKCNTMAYRQHSASLWAALWCFRVFVLLTEFRSWKSKFAFSNLLFLEFQKPTLKTKTTTWILFLILRSTLMPLEDLRVIYKEVRTPTELLLYMSNTVLMPKGEKKPGLIILNIAPQCSASILHLSHDHILLYLL